jgi:lipopolysaccharide export system protein LptA
MAAFLNFPSGRDKSEGAGCGNSFFPQPASTQLVGAGFRASVLMRVLAAGLGGSLLTATLAVGALAADAAPANRAAAAARVASKSSSSAAKQAASSSGKDAKGGAQNSPFGMLKFSADNGPIQIKADSLSLDYKGNSVEFKGAVHAIQSGTTLTSKTLKVIYGEKFGDIKEVIALGDVKMMQGGRWATGQRAVLDEVKHTVEMTGAPVIHDGPDQVAGRRIIIYLDTEKSYVEGASAVIFPRNGKKDNEPGD